MLGEIEKMRDGEDFKMFRTTCDCMSDDHILTICLEKDRFDIKSATFYYKTVIKGWWLERKDADDLKDWLYYVLKYYADTFTYRMKNALRILFTGYIELEGDFTFRGDRQILGVAEALIDLVKSDKKEEPPKEEKSPCGGDCACDSPGCCPR